MGRCLILRRAGRKQPGTDHDHACETHEPARRPSAHLNHHLWLLHTHSVPPGRRRWQARSPPGLYGGEAASPATASGSPSRSRGCRGCTRRGCARHRGRGHHPQGIGSIPIGLRHLWAGPPSTTAATRSGDLFSYTTGGSCSVRRSPACSTRSNTRLGFATPTPGATDSDVVVFDVVPGPDGRVVLHAAEEWDFPDVEQFFVQLPGVSTTSPHAHTPPSCSTPVGCCCRQGVWC